MQKASHNELCSRSCIFTSKYQVSMNVQVECMPLEVCSRLKLRADEKSCLRPGPAKRYAASPAPSLDFLPLPHNPISTTSLQLILQSTAIMGRLHSNGKGISASAIPYSRNPPAWLKTTPDAVVEQICRLAKKGATPSQIGVQLRDSQGVAQVRVVTGMEFIFERHRDR
jgi:hypothetical protein